MIGIASGNTESFEFTISTASSGKYRLDVRYSGDGDHNVTGAGIWASVRKAREVAEQIAAKSLEGAHVIRDEKPSTPPTDQVG